MEDQRLTFTISEAARLLGISRNLCYDLARRGELPGLIRLGGKRVVISKIALQKMLEGNGRTSVAPS